MKRTTMLYLASALCTLLALTVACTDSAAPAPPEHPAFDPGDPPDSDDLAPQEIRAFEIRTFEGSGETVHPDIAIVPQWWKGSSWRLVATPYPGGDAKYENPSGYLGRSWTHWKIPDGLINPIVTPKRGGYLSDPDQLYDPASDKLWMYYRQVSDSNRIMLVRSSDGVQWDSAQQVTAARNHELVSPSVVRLGPKVWRMWSVNAGTAGCTAKTTTVEMRRSSDGITWSDPVPVTLTHPTGLFAWHIDVEWIPSRREYWAVFNAKGGGCTTGELDFATSPDGITWTVAPSPLLVRGVIDEFSDVVYRASFAYQARTDYVTFWYSGARADKGRYTWRTAVQRLPRTELFARVNAPRPVEGTALRMSKVPEHRGPPLTNSTAP